MAEIKRSRAGQSFLTKPIGVVDVTTGADKAYAAKAETKRRIGEIAFDFAKKIQVSEGREWASEILVEERMVCVVTKKYHLTWGLMGKKKQIVFIKKDIWMLFRMILVPLQNNCVWKKKILLGMKNFLMIM